MENALVDQQVEGKTQEQLRGLILDLEKTMIAMPEHQVEIKTTHYFSDGIYMREVFIPKGTTVTGKIHLTGHLSILSQGDLSVLTEDGIKRLQASTVVRSMPGIKRAAFAHEDSVWITIHPNTENEKDVEKLENRLVVESYDQFLEASKPKEIEGGK